MRRDVNGSTDRRQVHNQRLDFSGDHLRCDTPHVLHGALLCYRHRYRPPSWTRAARARVGHKTKEVRRVEGESFLGLEVRANDGTNLGRVTEVITDGITDEVTHLVLEWEGVNMEVPLSAVVLDEDGDFATYSPDASDVEPGDHVGDEYRPGDHVGGEYKPGGYSPAWEAIPDQEDYERRGQFVHVGDLDEPPVSPAQVAREDWEDEPFEPDSGYPENDAFIDEQTGEETYAYRDGDDLQADVAEVLDSTEVYDDTGIRLRRIVGTVVVLGGVAASREDLDAVVVEILDLDGVADVDTTDVDVR
jgi:sporulation protein YlmC with PRC-barrel domain